MLYINVVICDAFPIIRWALHALLSNISNIKLGGVTDNIEQALTSMMEHRPNVIVFGSARIESTQLTSISETIRRFNTNFVLFAEIESWETVEKFISAGVLGFVTMESPVEDLVKAIYAVSQNQLWISPALRNVKTEKAEGGDSRLTNRELEIVSLIKTGMTSRQIGEQLCLSINTIESHRKRIFKKMNVKNSIQLCQLTSHPADE